MSTVSYYTAEGLKKLREELAVKERKKFEDGYRKGSCYHEFTISGK